MNKDIRLYLGGELVEWQKVPDILLTYERTSYLNPTVTKNSYSKQITIDGTKANNAIFDHIWKLDRIMDGGFTLYNPSQRVQFELYNNGEIVEKGYAKLDSIDRNGYKIAYNITLYGGLGSFFYNLAYDINTDKERTLADLNYMGGSDPDNEFNFTISKDAVKAAWDALARYGHNTGATRMYDFITFVPCYNGTDIENFDSDRVLINVNGMDGLRVRYTDGNTIVNGNFPMYISDGEQSYSSTNGYLEASMMRQCSEWEMRGLRSYLQRPALSVKGLFRAICDPQNNGGFNVVLDKDFASPENPYYENAFITLPMLSPETDATDEFVDWGWYISDQFIYTGDGVKTIKWRLASVEPVLGTPDSFTMDIEVHANITGATAERLYTSTMNNNSYDPYDDDPLPQLEYYGCTCLQLYGFGDGTPWQSKSARCGSNVVCLTSKRDGQYIGVNSINTWWRRPYTESDVQYNFGYWKKVSGSDYVWHNETDDTDIVHIQMDCNLMSFIPNIALATGNVMIMNGALVAAKCGCCFDAQYYDYYLPMDQGTYRYWNQMSIDDKGSEIVYKVNGKMRSYQPVTKKDLLGGMEGTPCDWLLSYCKLFGLFIEKDKVEDTIYIKMRNNWYKDEVVDLEEHIDRSKSMSISPLTFESKWYSFSYGEASGKFMDSYLKRYSMDFGKQMIDTQYNFDADEIGLIEDTKFRNGLTALEKSNYFNTKYDANGKEIPQCLYNWCTVTYRNDASTLETNMCLPQTHTIVEINPNTPKEFYDCMPKLQMHNSEGSAEDGEGVLVFFNGLKGTGNADYWIDDDIDEMFIDSENPCHLQTMSEWNAKMTERIAIRTTTLPEFSRYVVFNNIVTCDWDFGYTKEMYVPYYGFDPNRTVTIYDNFWKSYIQDLYSVDTRIVECYVDLKSNDVNDFMKRFYWWDNSIWVCTKVQDFDIALDKSTKCSFTKVNDKAAYLEMPTFNDRFFNFYRTNGQRNIPAQGTADERSVYFNLDCSHNWVVTMGDNGFCSFDPQYPTSGEFGMGYIIKAVFLPNYAQEPRYALFIADNLEGEQRMIRVWQEGYIKEKQLSVEPNSILFQKVVDGSVQVSVTSSSNWSCSAPSWVSIGSVSGTSGVTTINVSASTNQTGEERTAQVAFRNDEGLEAMLSIRQKGNAKVTLEQNEILPVYNVPASGGNVFYRLVNETGCTIEPEGNTERFAVASGLVSYHTTVQPSSGTNFWIHFDPNNTTVTRNASFYAYYVEDGGRYSVYPTRVQLPLQQAASGNTVVEFQSKEYSTATTLGASFAWTATTSSAWITLSTASGSSSDSSISYSVSQNNGSYRVGYIYITYKDEMGYYCQEVIEVRQEGVDNPIIVTPSAITVDSRGGDYMVSVDSPTAFTVDAADADVTSRNPNAFSVHIGPNDGYGKEFDIEVSANGETHSVHVTQGSSYPDDYVLDYAPEGVVFESSGGIIHIKVRSDGDWSIEQGNNIE